MIVPSRGGGVPNARPTKKPHAIAGCGIASALAAALLLFAVMPCAAAESDPAHMAADTERPLPWPDGIIPYDISKLAQDQQATVKQAMQRWMDTGARIAFVPRTTQKAYVSFTGRTNAGNNTAHTGYKAGARADINITAFWWRQGEWMPAHELGHVLGFHHEHARWDRDRYVTVHYENIKPGRSSDYDWIPRTNWLVNTVAYDYYSIMHYRVCWASRCESQCRDGDGTSPCAVIDPVGTNFDGVIGQWSSNRISVADGEKARRAYGVGQTLYVNPARSKAGSGTLADPYRNLAECRRVAPKKARFILLARDGTFSSPP
jgi:hypothetical protein